MSSTTRENVSLVLDGREFRAWWDIELHTALDSIDTFTFAAPFEPERREFREAFRPFTFRQLEIHTGGELDLNGTLLDITPDMHPDGRIVSVSGYSVPGVLADCSMPASSFPLEWNGLTLHQIAERICDAFGIGVFVQTAPPPAQPAVDPDAAAREERRRASRARSALAELRNLRTWRADAVSRDVPAEEVREFDQQIARARARLPRASTTQGPTGAPLGAPIDGPPFDRVSMEVGQTPWAFLSDLAKQRSCVLGNTATGDLAILKSTSGGRPVARLREGVMPLLSVTPTFNAQGYFSELTGLAGATAGGAGGKYTLRNPRGGDFFRPSTFTVDDTDVGDVPAATNAKLARMFGNMVSYVVEVPTWRDPQGAIWQPNTTITLYAPSAMIYRETEVLVREVTRKLTGGATTATLGVVLLGAFSGGLPDRFPWDE